MCVEKPSQWGMFNSCFVGKQSIEQICQEYSSRCGYVCLCVCVCACVCIYCENQVVANCHQIPSVHQYKPRIMRTCACLYFLVHRTIFLLYVVLYLGSVLITSIIATAMCSTIFSIHYLTHWGRDKMHAITQATFSDAFSWIQIHEFRLRYHWSLFLRFELTIFQHWFR